MFEEEKNKNSLISDESKLINKSEASASSISVFMDKLHTINGLHLVAGAMQVFMGLCVVALSLLNSIQPTWLATVMAVFGSIATIIGFYFTYYTFTSEGAFDTLLHKAIKRVINFQN